MLVDLYDRPSGCGRTLEVLREREREEGRKTKDGKIGTGKGEEWERETAEVGCGSRLGRIQSQPVYSLDYRRKISFSLLPLALI